MIAASRCAVDRFELREGLSLTVLANIWPIVYPDPGGSFIRSEIDERLRLTSHVTRELINW